MIRVCFHGAESTGKSVLAERLGLPWVPEYGRLYCEERGTELTMADLLAIAEGQDAANRAAAAARPPLLILDTEVLLARSALRAREEAAPVQIPFGHRMLPRKALMSLKGYTAIRTAQAALY